MTWMGGAIGAVLEGVDQERVVRETGVPFAALGVEDPEGRRAPRRPVAVVRDERLGALADDVAAQADPRPASQLEPDAGRLVDRGREAAGEPGRIEDQEQGLRAPGERGESMESIGDPGRLVGLRQSTAGQVEDEHVDRAAGEQRARDRQPLVQAGRGDDDEPLEADAAGDGLDRVEAARQVEPGHDRARAWASAATRSASVVRPLEPSPRIATLADFGRPPGPRIASSAAKPVWMTRSSPRPRLVAGLLVRRLVREGAIASAPTTRGAAAPQRAWRPATAASTSPRGVVIGRLD